MQYPSKGGEAQCQHDDVCRCQARHHACNRIRRPPLKAPEPLHRPVGKKHPVATTILLRAKIDNELAQASSPQRDGPPAISPTQRLSRPNSNRPMPSRLMPPTSPISKPSMRARQVSGRGRRRQAFKCGIRLRTFEAIDINIIVGRRCASVGRNRQPIALQQLRDARK